MNRTSEFVPQWASPPGETIAEALATRNWTRGEFASRINQSTDAVEALITGATPMTIGLARRLNEVIGASVAFWMARDKQYREDAERLRQRQDEWSRSLPTAEMARLGWLPSSAKSEIEALLDFFDVSSVPAWHRRYSDILESVEFKTSPSFSSQKGAVVSWLRQGERVAAEATVKPWEPESLSEVLSNVRALTRIGHPERFIPKLKEAMASVGVVVAIIPAPTGCRASGATVWTSDRSALMLLSGRHLSDDHFWFTFYHECGHLLLHRDTHIFIDDDETIEGVIDAESSTARQPQEDEANAFAVKVLVTRDVMERLQRIPPTYEAVLRLAAEAGIAPGILVGQLQKMGRVGPERLNRLKRRYRWADGKLVSRERK